VSWSWSVPSILGVVAVATSSVTGSLENVGIGNSYWTYVEGHVFQDLTRSIHDGLRINMSLVPEDEESTVGTRTVQRSPLKTLLEHAMYLWIHISYVWRQRAQGVWHLTATAIYQNHRVCSSSPKS
jgi:hypothetical protein